MFSSRKRSLAIALTVISVLAMLAPAAIAAPEWVHGVVITSPTTAVPVGVEGDRGDRFVVHYTVTIVGLQVNEAQATFTLFDQNGDREWSDRVELEALIGVVDADVELTQRISGLRGLDGWYDLEVCVSDSDDNKWCDRQAMAVLVDDEEPRVDLLKPADDEYRGATFITGQAYLLVGKAWDKFGVESAEFQYCIEGRECRWSDDWVKIADAAPTPGIPDQWDAIWDSTQVPDSEKRFGMIRMCAFDFVGNSNCEYDRFEATVDSEGYNHYNPWHDAHWVFVNNRFEIDLVPGWNLISLPLVPYDSAIESVLFHLIAHGTVKQVVTYGPTGWEMWSPAGPSTLLTMVDGKGYWIEMVAPEELTVVGTWSWAPGSPPQYSVVTGWNMIGYTQWGRPTFFPPKFAMEYLGPAVHPNVNALWAYDAPSGIWDQTLAWDDMEQGAGYWLASIAPGTFFP